MEKVLVTGAGGFVGHHLVRRLKEKGYWVRGADIEIPAFSSLYEADEFILADLTNLHNCLDAAHGMDKVYNLAALNGSIELIETNHADLVYNNSLININMAKACLTENVTRIFYASSACAYPVNLQSSEEIHELREEDAYPANPDSEYGWEKLFAERHWKSYEKDHNLQVRIGRYFNIYGPGGVIDTIKSKAPMALTKKVIDALNMSPNSMVKVWGDGRQKRSFCYVDDCVDATIILMESSYSEPVNIGTPELVEIGHLVDMIANIEGKKVVKDYQLNAVQGVRTRQGDFRKVQQLGWSPKVSLESGLVILNKFVHEQIR